MSIPSFSSEPQRPNSPVIISELFIVRSPNVVSELKRLRNPMKRSELIE